MEIYERIMNRRKELGLTADEVADALGVSRSTIYRYESAYIEKVPLSSLEPLAKVLQTTPHYLMGWDNAPAAGPATTEDLSREALVIARAYDAADEGIKNSVAKLLDVKREVFGSEEGVLSA